ncbi:MAG: prepilin-type N-terminal cleavage/methylation domain-containing protein [Isosphaeraceae bacterium]
MTKDKGQRTRRAKARRGITLTEILIAIMILGIGLVSLAALFPIGLSRLREASRYSRSAYLSQSGATDMSARGLLFKKSFFFADFLNSGYYPFWFATPSLGGPDAYDPFTQDTQFYGGEGVTWDLTQTPPVATYFGATANRGTGLPIAYDPLWRHQTRVYLDPLNQSMPEARFGAGTDGNATFIAADSDGGPPSAWGLQRLTNFNRATATNALGQVVPLFPADNSVPGIFVSPEDTVLQDPSGTTYTIDGLSAANGGIPVVRPSPIIPDLNTSGGTPTNDWRYSWIFTGLQTNVSPFQGPNQTSLGATFEGNIVIFENRPFGISQVTSPLGPVTWQVDGETVVEAVWGYSTSVATNPGLGIAAGYGSGADRTVLLRWPANMPDPVVKAGDWIADVTYERNAQTVISRFLSWSQQVPPLVGLPNPINNGEWDNLPAQRCFWYQVQRVTPPGPALGPFAFANDPTSYRYMVVYVNSSLLARTILNSNNGQPMFRNAALICPSVVNVIPQTFTTIAVQ